MGCLCETKNSFEMAKFARCANCFMCVFCSNRLNTKTKSGKNNIKYIRDSCKYQPKCQTDFNLKQFWIAVISAHQSMNCISLEKCVSFNDLVGVTKIEKAIK